MSYTCSFCNNTVNQDREYPNHLCEVCYDYFRQGGTLNPLPSPGVIEYDKYGYVICHICGKAYKKLGSHVYYAHKMTTSEYKEKFGLCRNARLTDTTYSRKMHDLAYKYNMPEQLERTGVNTRIQLGETHMRLGKEIRLQEIIDKKARIDKRKQEEIEYRLRRYK